VNSSPRLSVLCDSALKRTCAGFERGDAENAEAQRLVKELDGAI